MRLKPIEYLRVSLLDRCNFTCFYCRPSRGGSVAPFGKADLSNVKSAIKVLCELGVRKVRFTGGEPTLHDGLPEAIAYCRRLDQRLHLALTTNGFLLGEMAMPLSQAGLDSANVSIDSVNRSTFRAITGVDALDRVVAGIEAAIGCIPKVKLNTVVIRGINDQEVPSLIGFADEHGVDIRFIEFMPNETTKSQHSRMVPGAEIRSRLPDKLIRVDAGRISAARYYVSPALRIKVGFIEAVSRPFCQDCNRVRLTANGDLYGCLFAPNHINLFEILNCGSADVMSQVQRLLDRKEVPRKDRKDRGSDVFPSFVIMGG